MCEISCSYDDIRIRYAIALAVTGLLRADTQVFIFLIPGYWPAGAIDEDDTILYIQNHFSGKRRMTSRNAQFAGILRLSFDPGRV